MPKSTDSTTKFKVDITDFKAAMQEAARYVKLAESEFNEASAGLGKWSNSADGLTAKLKQLDKVLEAQKRQLSVLETEYERVVKEQGANSKGAEELRIRINNQNAAIKRTESQMDHYADTLVEVTKETNGLGDATLEAGKDAKKSSEGFTVMKGALANLVADGVKLAINSVKKLSGEIINLGKQSISNYARYEQLVGGVETLFGAGGLTLKEYAKSVGKSTKEIKKDYNKLIKAQTNVMKNAKKAYKTAGMSANEYMDTVTSFSAALISGLDGDTVKAAKVADMAITDMADNANKMGTSIEMIQNAYQGFAKQNFTMLDNLKLGYGGTKGEMARLVQESGILGKAGEELTAKNLTEKVSFDQMIEAIHKVQQTMGITGTTAKEAAGTIEGSTGSMHAAWENLLTGIADDTQDIDQLWDDFIKSAVGSAKNMLPRIKKLYTNFTKFIDKKMREHFPDFMKDFDKVKKAIQALFKFIKDNGDEILSILQGIAVAFVTYRAVATITQVISAFKAFVTAVKAGETALVALNTTMSISPVGLFAAAIAGLVTTMLALNAAEERAKNAQYGLNAEQEQYIENAKQLREEYQEMDSARDENNGKIQAEYDYLKDLKDEYNTLIANNGKVKKGYEARADFILNELARAMGVERDEIDKVIEKNGKLGESLDQLMIKQQAQALIESTQADYNKAIEERAGALEEYQNNLKSVQKEQSAYNSLLRQANMSEKDFFEYRTAKKNGDWEKQLEYRKKYTIETLDGLERTFDAYNKAQDGLFSAEDAYVGFSQTIQNYEGLSVAVLEGDSEKIKYAINKLQNDVLTAETGNARTLELQAKKFKQNYEDMQQAVTDGIAGISKEDLKASKDLLKKANKELIKYFKSTDVAKEAKNRGYDIPKFITNGIKEGSMSVDSAMQRLQTLIDFDSGEYGVGAAATAKKLGLEIPELLANGILSGTMDLEQADKAMIEVITTALEDAAADAGIKAEDIPESISAAVLEGNMTIKKAVKKIKSTAADGLTDSDGTFKKKGNDAASDFATGITDKKEDAKLAGQTIFDAAAGALSGNTTDSGKNFAYGFANGINDVLGTGRIGETAGLVSKDAIDALRKAQQEGSPSKLTFKSGVNFTQGFINGIVSLQSQLVKATQKVVKAAAKQLVKLDNYNFDEVQQNTSSYLSKTMASRIEYMQNKISYQNEKKLDEFNEKIIELENQRDKKLEKLQSKSEKAKDATEKKAIKNQIASTKERYQKLIKIQEEYRDAYQTASGKMINEFNKAISDYQAEAQSLIDSTVKGITDTYKARYDGLLSKQNELISKLKSAGQLFEISGAGVITVSDIKEQTKQIQDYASKLKKIKSKVSNDLFNQIASYDMKEGEAFINQLLSLSDAELKAYDAAYSEKISLADSLSKDIYKQDFKRVSKDYKKAIKEAMAGIPAQLEELGENSMKGFLKGLTKNTKYMDKTVKSFVNEMVGEFKKELKINSPSRVMEGLGEYSGEGFGDGLRNMIKYVKSVASEIVGATTTSFDGVKSNLGNVKGVIGTNANGLNAASQTVVNNYSLVQNNTSPKSLTALETYNARRQQIAMIKAATQNA